MGCKVNMLFKIAMSSVFFIVFIVRTIYPELNIDNTSVMLLILIIVPWFIQYIKSLEINGIGKVELVDKKQKKEMEKKATDAGLLKSTRKSNENIKYSFYNLRYEDPKLALAGLRIELENSLRKIAESYSIDVSHSGIAKMTNILNQHQLINNDEQSIIYDIIGILNKAVHSQLTEYESETFDWIFDLGFNLLELLNNKQK